MRLKADAGGQGKPKAQLGASVNVAPSKDSELGPGPAERPGAESVPRFLTCRRSLRAENEQMSQEI